MQQWEYMTVEIGDGYASGDSKQTTTIVCFVNEQEVRRVHKGKYIGESLTSFLNRVGKEGWEFKAAVRQLNSYLIFRKPIGNFPPP